MFTLAIGTLLAYPGLAGGHEKSDISLRLNPRISPGIVTSLKFRGKTMRRSEEPAIEALELSLSNGEDVVLDLTESEELKGYGICGSHHVGTHDVTVTGCDGEDRSITIGGHGSWEYEASSAIFRRLDPEDVLNDCGSVEPPVDDGDSMAIKAAKAEMMANGEPMIAQNMLGRTFDTEVRYYYDISLLERYDNDHARAQAAVRELNEHGKIFMRHETLGMPINLVMRVEPVFVDLRTHAGPEGALDGFRAWLSGRDLCDDRTIAFHHLITDHRQGDRVAGVAYVGAACHVNCFNSGITEIATTVARAALVLAHELGHNLGAQHTFHESNGGRHDSGECRGIMSYGEAPETWSPCAREDWEEYYAEFVRGLGQSRADTCLVPSTGAVPPSPTPAGPAPAPQPTPPPVQRPTPTNPTPNLPSECRTFPGFDLDTGFENPGATGVTSDAQCNALCVAGQGCTFWVWSPSQQECWLSTLLSISLISRSDRTAGLRCDSAPPVPAPTPRPAPLPTSPPTEPPTLSTPAPTNPPTEPPILTTPAPPLGAFQFEGTGVAGVVEIWGVDSAKGLGVESCFQAVQADARCTTGYFTYVARGDKNCGCKGDAGSLTIRPDTNADYYSFVPAPASFGFQFEGTGVAGVVEIWGVDSAKGLGVESCFQAVQADARCTAGYFTYVARGDKNCGCKGDAGSLSVRADRNADYYSFDSPSNPTNPTTPAAGEATCGGTADGASCVFPFTYEGTTYDACTTVDNDGQPWCFTENDGKWGNCECGAPPAPENPTTPATPTPPTPAAPTPATPVGSTCVTGQGEFGKWFLRGGDATVEECFERCTNTADCVAIDFAVGRLDSCRLYRSVENARIGNGGDHNRVFCTPSGKNTAQVCEPPSCILIPTLITVGLSTENSKTFDANVFECPEVVDKTNWIGDDQFGDTFAITWTVDKVTVRRTDSTGGWEMDLAFECTVPARRASSRRRQELEPLKAMLKEIAFRGFAL